MLLAVLFWVAAFDIYYSFQDMDVDPSQGLHSVPADFGPDTALAIAGFSHVMTTIFLVLVGLEAGLSLWWFGVCGGIALLLFWEHRLMQPQDLRNVNMAFFTLNGIVSPVMLAGVILGLC